MTLFDADIIIAGAGPSGLTVGCEAALGGAKVVILEKRNGPTWSRAGVLSSRVLEIFASRGLADRFLERAHELHTDPITRNGLWAGMGPVSFDGMECDYPFILMFPQIETEKILAERFLALGGEIRLQTEVTGLAQDADGVTVDWRGPSGEGRIRGRYLVGADGNRSVVRETLGIARQGTPARRIAVNVDAFIDNPYDDIVTVSNSESGWAMTYPLRDGLTRFAFIDAASTGEPPDQPLEIDEAKAMLRRVHGTDYGIERVDAINRFHDALYLAEKLREGRTFLVGEAVRVHYPAGGVGMNYCIQDAFNLGWKLAAVVGGHAEPDLLDTYEAERMPEIRALLDNIRAQTAIQLNFSAEHVSLKKVLAANFLPLPEVQREICQFLAGFQAAYPAPPGSPAIVGRRLTNLPARTADGREASVFELLRGQQFLLLDLTDSAALPTIRGGVPVVAAHAEPDREKLLEGLATLIVRPDGHVAWAGDRPLDQYTPEVELHDWIRTEGSAPAFDNQQAAPVA